MSGGPTIEPPYWAAIFTTTRTEEAADGDYAEMAERMEELAAQQPGYLGIETVGNRTDGITVSYWATEDDLRAWGRNAEHLGAQRLGRDRWYASYHLRIARVERSHHFPEALDPD